MKTVIRKSLVLVVLLATIVCYGNEISGNTNDGKSVKTSVTFKNVKNGSVLSIIDDNGLTLYKEVIKFNGEYTRGFDLTALPDGNYYFELNADTEIKVVPFKVTLSVVTFDKTSETIIIKPRVHVMNGKVFVSKLALCDLGREMEIKIYAENAELAYTGKIARNKENYVGKIYDFSTSEKGKYTIVINTEGRRFVKHIQI